MYPEIILSQLVLSDCICPPSKTEVTRIFTLYYITPVEVNTTVDTAGHASVTTTALPTVAID
jgi:hypothetical protein